jgi:hypothetical protein
MAAGSIPLRVVLIMYLEFSFSKMDAKGERGTFNRRAVDEGAARKRRHLRNGSTSVRGLLRRARSHPPPRQKRRGERSQSSAGLHRIVSAQQTG